jgi:phage terminase large subunit
MNAPKISMVQFAVVALALRLYVWQAAVMASVAAGKPTACVTPNGAGKTSIIIKTAALWCLHEHPGATVVLTSATFRAVRTQIFAALEQEREKFAGWTWNETEIQDAVGGRIIGFSTDSGAKFEGFHAQPGRPLMIIIDEAKSLPDDIFVAADRCQPTYLLYISSPGGNFGRFHDAFKGERFAGFQVGIRDCPHITPEFIAAMRAEYGEESDIYRSMIEGWFAKGKERGKIVQFADYERCRANPPAWNEGARQAFCDFADSGDLCIVATRDGNRLRIKDEWQPDGNKARVAERFEANLRELQGKGYELFGDEDGTGHGYITTLALRGLRIRGVRNNAPSGDRHHFNLNARQWWTFAKQVEQCRWILPDHETLKRQLCERHQNYVEKDGEKIFGRADGVLQLQPKRKEKGKSPNHADAIIGAAFDYPSLEAVSYIKDHGEGRASREFPDALPSRWAEAEQELAEANKMAGAMWG